MLSIKPRGFEVKDEESVLDLFRIISKETAGAYPSKERITEEGGLSKWLQLDKALPRFVIGNPAFAFVQVHILNESDGTHLFDVLDYYKKAFPDHDTRHLAIIQRLAVHPDQRRKGCAEALIEKSTEEIQRLELTPGVVVHETEKASLALFEKAGWQKANEYIGLHNKKMHSYFLPNRLSR